MSIVSRFIECTWNNETDNIFYYTEKHLAVTITNRVHVLVCQKSRCAIFEPSFVLIYDKNNIHDVCI